MSFRYHNLHAPFSFSASTQHTTASLHLPMLRQAAEAQLRNSGLGYTIIRPGPLFEEPGGRKALVFDQGNRISQVPCPWKDSASACSSNGDAILHSSLNECLLLLSFVPNTS